MSPSAIHPVVLVLGAGANIGAQLARNFAAKGYKVALAARRLHDETSAEGYLHIRSDFADPNSVTSAFEKAKQTFGPPSVVIYNGLRVPFPFMLFRHGLLANPVLLPASNTGVPAKSPLDLALADFQRDMAVNTGSVLVAAKQAVLSFEQLPGTSSRTFIYTGNILNTEPILPLTSLGRGKSATAHLILNASVAYRDKGYK